MHQILITYHVTFMLYTKSPFDGIILLLICDY